MKKLFLILLTALVLPLASCSDKDEVFKPEEDNPTINKPDVSILGTYLLANVEDPAANAVTSLISDQTYITLKKDGIGTLYNAQSGTSSDITWEVKDDTYSINLGNTIKEIHISDKSIESINYKEMIVDFDDNHKYTFVKSETPEPEWNKKEDATKAQSALVTVNNSLLAASTTIEAGSDEIVFKLGDLKLNGDIEWIESSKLAIANGEDVSIAMNDQTYILVSYKATGKDGVWNRIGWIDYSTKEVTWADETELSATTKNVKLATVPETKNFEALYEENGEIMLLLGECTETTSTKTAKITWKTPVSIGNGINPDITITADFKAILTYEQDGKVVVNMGVATNDKLSDLAWNTPAEIGVGERPFVTCNSKGDAFLSYNLPNLPLQVSRIGKIGDSSVDFGNVQYFGRGIGQSISMNNFGLVSDYRIVEAKLNLQYQTVFEYQTDWMKSLTGDKLIAAYSIPGTHDSAARYGGSFYQCQTLTLMEQLYAGIRFLDIRCKYNNGELGLYHGGMHQRITLDQVLELCYTFMDTNPSEAIIMSIRNENDGANDQERENLQRAIYDRLEQKTDRWFVEDRIPTLDEARNKIVLLRRFHDKLGDARGIDASQGWDDKATFTINNVLRVQDEYGLSGANKFPKVEALLIESSTTTDDMLYINFLSATGPLFPNPKNVAKVVNPKFETYLDNNSGKHRFGCVLYDFPAYSSVEKLIKSN